MIILDTSIISELVRPQPHPHVVAWVRNPREVVGTTAVNTEKLKAGLRLMPEGRPRR